MKLLTFTILLLVTFVDVSGQDCYSESDGTQYSNPNSLIRTYCVNTYYHIVRRSNSSGGISNVNSRIAEVEAQFSEAFNQYNIYFSNSGYEFIDSDIAYNSSFPHTSLANMNESSNRIDIYIMPDEFSCRGGVAYCSNSNVTSIILSGTLRNTGWIISSNFAAHEMGHILGLQHTFGGTFDPIETTNMNNCTIAGDRFCDTPASFQGNSSSPCSFNSGKSGVNFEVTSDCIWTNPMQEPGTGTTYTPDLNNYMEYTHPDCMSNFSPLQVEAMRAKIESPTIISPAVSSIIWGNYFVSGSSNQLNTVNFVSNRYINGTINALNFPLFNWDLTNSNSPSGSSSTNWSTSNSGHDFNIVLPDGGSSSFEISYENYCDYGPGTYTFIHSGGFYRSNSTVNNGKFSISAISGYDHEIKSNDKIIKSINIDPKINDLIIISSNGNRIIKNSYPNGLKEVTVDLTSLPNGIYFVLCNPNDRKYFYKTKIVIL